MSSPGGKQEFDGKDNRELLGVDFCPYGESPCVECYEQPQITITSRRVDTVIHTRERSTSVLITYLHAKVQTSGESMKQMCTDLYFLANPNNILSTLCNFGIAEIKKSRPCRFYYPWADRMSAWKTADLRVMDAHSTLSSRASKSASSVAKVAFSCASRSLSEPSGLMFFESAPRFVPKGALHFLLLPCCVSASTRNVRWMRFARLPGHPAVLHGTGL